MLFGGWMKKTADTGNQYSVDWIDSVRGILYPAVADSVDLPDLSFRRRKDEDSFILLTTMVKDLFLQKHPSSAAKLASIDDVWLKNLIEPIGPESKCLNITFNIISRRAALVAVKHDKMSLTIEAHWNLFIPYFEQIKVLPIIHPEILNTFAQAVFYYVLTAVQNPRLPKNALRELVIDGYKNKPELILASLDIFNKTGIYHIHPTNIWKNRIAAVNDLYRLEIDSSSAASVPDVIPEFLEEVSRFLHKVVKNYAFRYVDYLWTQRYKIIFGAYSGSGMVGFDGKDIVVNINPLMNRTKWKPALYLSLGYAIMMTILQASGRNDLKENIFLATMKTWNRYLSLDEAAEQRSTLELFQLPDSSEEDQCCSMLECMVGRKSPELVDDFIMLMNYSSKETFEGRLNILNESRYEKRPSVYFEQLWGTVRNLNASLMKNNINYSKLIEVLRNDNIDHFQLAEFLRTGWLGGIEVVDISEWLLLRTLLYDLINAPKVFRNDYNMLLRVLTKVIKSLIVYVWTLGLDDDARYEKVSAYIAKLMNDIFVFNRVKIYEIVAEPVECLEAEAVTGYLLNWASSTSEEQSSIIRKVLSGLSRNVVANLSVQTVSDVDQLVSAMSIRTSGLFGFYLYKAYRWGSTEDPLTARIRSHFPQLLETAQSAILPAKRIMGGAMILLLLAQIVSDERDGFAENIRITEEERNIVRDLITQCIDWDQKHFVIMVAGIAAGYMGSIDGWTLRQFDTLLGRYDGGDRVVLRSVVQYDVDNLIERTLVTSKDEEIGTLINKIQLLRFGVDAVVSDQTNKFLRMMACRYGIAQPEVMLKKKDIHELVAKLSGQMNIHDHCL